MLKWLIKFPIPLLILCMAYSLSFSSTGENSLTEDSTSWLGVVVNEPLNDTGEIPITPPLQPQPLSQNPNPKPNPSNQSSRIEWIETLKAAIIIYLSAILLPSLYAALTSFLYNLAFCLSQLTPSTPTTSLLDVLCKSMAYSHYLPSTSKYLAFGSCAHSPLGLESDTLNSSELAHDLIFVVVLSFVLIVLRIVFVSLFVTKPFEKGNLRGFVREKSSNYLNAASYDQEETEDMEDSESDDANVNIFQLTFRNYRKNPLDMILTILGIRKKLLRRRRTNSTSSSNDNLNLNSNLNSNDNTIKTRTRLATAAFRLMYYSCVAILGAVSFRSAEFWPKSLGGINPNSGTLHCWDLSGGVIGGLDSNYDGTKVALRIYYLVQASFHLHSVGERASLDG